MKNIVIGILAHVDSGKTTLSEALLYCSGSIDKQGRVDRKDSFLDNITLERERGITIFSKQAVFDYGKTHFTLLDTPGHVDFSAETERTLKVLDYAVLVISGTDGVQSHTYTLWKLLEKYNIPCFIFINKMDINVPNKYELLSHLKTKLNEGCIDFSDSDSMNENIALCDERLLDIFSEYGKIEDKDISDAIRERKVFPCMFGSALRLEGITEFLDCISRFTCMREYPKEFGGVVYKISEDNKHNRLTFLKITGGVLKVKEVLESEKNTSGEKVDQIRIYSGAKFTQTDSASVGTVCAVTGITFARSGDILGYEKNEITPILSPVLTYTIYPPKGLDSSTLFAKLRILEDEDPQLNVEWNEITKEIRVQLMGDIQLEILRSVIKERFDIDVTFDKGSIIYKETIIDTVEGVGHFEPLKHYAEVHLLLRPGKPGSGIVIRSECSEDVLDRNWQRLILTNLSEKTHLGVLTGSPITDIEIILVSGKAHLKHTEGGDFRQASYRAVRHGLRCATSVLLEPIYDFMLEVPKENIGRAMSDVQRMKGKFYPPEITGDMTVLKGSAPAFYMQDYTKEVIRYTKGKGRLVCSLKGYEPCTNANEVIEAISYNPDADLQNPCGSVFCSHGAGYNVKWDEVKKYMHLPEYLAKQGTAEEYSKERILAKCATQKDVFALDRELMQLFEQTYGTVKRKTEQTSAVRYDAKESSYKRKGSTAYDGKEYLLVDGYNVIFSWEELNSLAKENIDVARNTLINILCNYQGYKGCELILVFDAYKVKSNTREVETEGNINIVYTKEAETADMYIEKVTHNLAKNNRVRVVTSDGLEQLIILGSGALRISSRAFKEEVQQAESDIRRIITEFKDNKNKP